MTDKTARHTARAQEEVSRAPAAASEKAAAPEPSTALEREHAETKDRLLRALAEMENLRKRTDREIAEKLIKTAAVLSQITSAHGAYAPVQP